MHRATLPLPAAAIAVALALHGGLLWPYLARTHADFDALHLYFPLAEALLRGGLAFLADERSLQAPLFSYAYPALLGAALGKLKLANYLLSLVLLLIVARVAWLAHSRAAAVCAAFLFALSPLLRPWLATAITEPPFLFLCGVWIWGLAEWLRTRSVGYAVVAALALGLAILTRASLFYLPILLALVFFAVSWRGVADPRARAIAVIHLAALVLPFALLAKNAVVFGFPFVATGAGNALYLGNNPLTGGYDPGYLGLAFDVGSIARDQSHLTLEADRLLGAAGKLLVASEGPMEQVQHHARKLAAFLFVSNAETTGHVLVLRSWRIALFVLAAVGIVTLRRQLLGGILALTLAYQILVHMPVLYTHRYSVGAIDLWLTILAAVGLGALAVEGSPRHRALVVAALVAGLAAGAVAFRYGGTPQPDVFRAARLKVWEGTPQRYTVTPGAPLEIPVRNAPRFHPWSNHVLVIDAAISGATSEGACGWIRLSYRRESDAAFGAGVSRHLRADGQVRRLQIGATAPMALNAEGVLRIEVACRGPATLDVRRIAVYAPRGGFDYRARVRGEPLDPALER